MSVKTTTEQLALTAAPSFEIIDGNPSPFFLTVSLQTLLMITSNAMQLIWEKPRSMKVAMVDLI